MRLWKVRTRADINIETNWFGYKKRHCVYFTYKTKYVYAETKDDAKMKYRNSFFTPMEDGYNKETLKCAKYYAENGSLNMEFDLPFNCKIVHSRESVDVLENVVNENILVIRQNMTADDFRDWYINGTTVNQDIDDFDWIDK